MCDVEYGCGTALNIYHVVVAEILKSEKKIGVYVNGSDFDNNKPIWKHGRGIKLAHIRW